MKAHEYIEQRETLEENLVYFKLRLAEQQREHIQLTIMEVNNVDTWAKDLRNSILVMEAHWKEIKRLNKELYGYERGQY